jgi:branched-chain amino acid transport system ATP-binding protein
VPAEAKRPVLTVDGATKRFGGLTAVDGVGFEVVEGEILGMIGPNGSGKSTMLNLVSGLHRLSAGRIAVGGTDVSGRPPHRIAALGVSRTFQLLRLFPSLTVFENALTGTHLLGSHDLLGAIGGGRLTGDEEKRLARRAHEVLEFVGLSHRAGARVEQLTAGEGRLLELARALAPDPRLLLLDEPAAGLNTSETAVLEGKLRELLRQRGTTMILVEHDIGLVMHLASRVLVLSEGRALAFGTPEEVQRDPLVVQAYLGLGGVRRRRKKAANG